MDFLCSILELLVFHYRISMSLDVIKVFLHIQCFYACRKSLLEFTLSVLINSNFQMESDMEELRRQLAQSQLELERKNKIQKVRE